MKNKIRLQIIAIAISLFSISAIGMAYAYFTANISGNDDDTTVISVKAGKLNITLDGGPSIVSDAALPGPDPIATKEIAVIGENNTTLTMPYSVILEVENNEFLAGSLYYTITAVNEGETGIISPSTVEPISIGTGSGSYLIGSGSFGMSNNAVHRYILKIFWPDNNQDQSDEMGKFIKAKVTIIGEPAKDVVQDIGYTSTENSITVNVSPNYQGQILRQEYSIDGINWQESPIFDELGSASTYTVQIRIITPTEETIYENVEVHTKGVPTPTITSDEIIGDKGDQEWYTGSLLININSNQTGTTPIKSEYQIIEESSSSELAYTIKALEKYKNAKLMPLKIETLSTSSNEWLSGNAIAIDKEGIYTINMRTINTATNEVATNSFVVKLDSTPPTPMTIFETKRTNSLSVSITAGGKDSISYPVTYKYYLNDELIETTNNRSFEYKNLEPDTFYTYKIEAINSAGLISTYNESSYTLSNLVGTLDFTATNNTITVTLDSTDASRVERYEYSLNGQNWSENNIFIDLIPASTYTIQARIIDNEQNVIDAGQVIAYTKGVPTPTHEVANPNGQSSWYTNDVTININPNLGGSTNVKTEYQINNGKWENTLQAVVTTNGINNLKYRNINTKTNEIITRDITIKLDKTAPNDLIVYEEHNTNTITAKIIAGGIDTESNVTYHYYLNDTLIETTSAKEHIFNNISSETNKVKIEAINEAGLKNIYVGDSNNQSPILKGSLTYTSTETSIIVSLPVNYPEYVAKYEYSIDNNNWSTNNTFNNLNIATTYTIYARITNLTGEIIPIESIQATTDGISTPTHSLALPNGSNGWYTSDITVMINQNKIGTASIQTQYQINNGDWTEGTIILITEEGIHSINYRNINLETGAIKTGNLVVKLDKTKPTNIFANAIIRKNDLTLSITNGGTDNTSFPVTYHYYLNDELIQTTEASVYTYDNLNAGTHYTYKIVAVNEAGLKTEYSASGTTAPELIPVLDYTSTKNTLTASLTSNLEERIIKYEYSLNGNTWQESNIFLTVEEASTYTIYARVTDIYGGIIFAESILAYTKGVPTPNHIVDAPNGTNNWYISNVSININTNQTGTTPILTEYKINDNEWTTGNNINISQEGTNNIYYRNTNTITKETISSSLIQIKISKTPPTQMLVNQTINKNDIAVEIVAGGIDNITNLVTYKYYINDILKETSTNKNYIYSGLNANSQYTIKIEAINDAGLITTYNGTTSQTAEELEGILYYTSNNNQITANIDVNYPERIAKKEYKLDNSPWQDSPIFNDLFTSSTYTLYARITDTLGGTIELEIASYTKGVPTPTHNMSSPEGLNNWYTSDVNISLATNQTGNTPILTEYKINSDDWATGTNINITTEGIHTLLYRNTNTKTNEVSNVNTITVKLDKTKPTAMNVEPIIRKNDITLTITSGGFENISDPVTYKYYLNNEIITTAAKSYQFMNLNANTLYSYKIEAINEAGLVTTYNSEALTAEELTVSIDSIATNNYITVNLVINYPQRASEALYSLDGLNWQPSNIFVDLIPASTYTIYAKITDLYGGQIMADAQTNYTKGVPSPSYTIIQPNGANGWYKTDPTITINPSVEGQWGPNIKTEYQINSGPWIEGTQAILTNESANNIINFRNINTKTNEKIELSTSKIKLDKSAPSIISVNETRRTNDITATITSGGTDDVSAPVTYKYYLNNVEKYTGPETSYKFEGLTPDTSYTVKIEAINEAGLIRTYQGNPANTAGILSGSLAYSSNASGTELTAILDNSTINYPERVVSKLYSIDAQNWQTNPKFTVAPGSTYTLYAKIVDSYGGEVSLPSITAYSKGLPVPSISVASGSKGKNSWYLSNVNLVIDKQQTGTTDIITMYKIGEEGSWQTGLNIELTTEGIYNIYYKNKNEFTMEETSENIIEIKIDKTLPSVLSVTTTPKVYEIELSFTGGDTSLSNPMSYWYYWNEELKTTIADKSYTYKDLAANAMHSLKIDAFNDAGLKRDWSSTVYTAKVLTCTLDYSGGTTSIAALINCNPTNNRASNTTYSIGGAYQQNNTFTGLTPASTYTLSAKTNDTLGSTVNISNISVYTSGIPTPTGSVTSGTKTDQSSDWYTSASVVYTINAKPTGVWGSNIKTEYRTRVNSGSWSNWTEGTLINLTAEGIHDIEYRNTNTGTSETSVQSAQVKIDRTVPSAPSFNITSGTLGNNSWYLSNVGVSITKGNDTLSGGAKITYTITGAQVQNETTYSSAISITAEGESTITAYTYDAAGNKSTAGTYKVKKDTQGPVFAGVNDTSTTQSTYDKRAGVTITDNQSGVVSSTDFTVSPTTNLVTGNNSITYTATDKAGNKTTKIRIIYYSGGICFASGTQILTELGYKSIENIKVGDIVYSMNTITMTTELKTVTELFKRRTTEIYKITIDNKIIETTWNHPFYVQGKGWIEARYLEIGDELIDINNKSIIVQNILIEDYDHLIDVYNFEVEDNHNYFVASKETANLFRHSYPHSNILQRNFTQSQLTTLSAILTHNYGSAT